MRARRDSRLQVFLHNTHTVAIPTLSLLASLFVPHQASLADQILVKFDTAAGHANAQGEAAIGPPNFGPMDTPFSSRGWVNGSLIKNKSGQAMTDLHLKITSNDTFDPNSTGGLAFPTKMFSADMKELTLTGGNIANLDSFWSQIPLSGDFGGVGMYVGRATPEIARPPEKKKEEVPNTPKTGKDTGSGMNCTGAGTCSFSPGNDTFVRYSDGSLITANTASESIIGSQILVDPIQLVGSCQSIPGAYCFSNSQLSIAMGASVYLSAPLTAIAVVPDNSVPGFDSVLQATFMWQESQANLTSRYLDELYATIGPGSQTTLLLRTNILGATGNMSHSGSSTGSLTVTNATELSPVPALTPAGCLVIAILLSMTGSYLILRRRGGPKDGARRRSPRNLSSWRTGCGRSRWDRLQHIRGIRGHSR